MTILSFRNALALALVVSSTASASNAYAQTAQTAPPPAPPVIERIDNGFVIAPDFKITDVDGDLGQLAGLYAGAVLDERLLIGAAAYWLANGSEAFRLTYGGLLAGWTIQDTSRIRFGVRGLAGVGRATLPIEGAALGASPFSPAIRFGARTPARVGTDILMPPTIRFGVKDDFLVFEPQGTVAVSVTDHIVINVGAGYRAVTLTDALRDRLDGPSGSIALEIGW